MHETLLYIIYNLHIQNQIITVNAIRQPLGWMQNSDFNLEAELNFLIDQGLLFKDKRKFYLTETGKKEASRINKIRFKTDFNRLVSSATDSKSYLDYCTELYGYPMPLFNMMDKEQLDYLFKTIQVAKNDTVLDLGCGSGSILNYLVQKYKVRGIGIDQLDEAIVKKCSNKISYIEGDIDNLSLYNIKPKITFAIDSFYFSSDLNGLVRMLKSIKNNRLYVFYSQYIFEQLKKDKSLLHFDNTRIACIFQENNLQYRVVDYSTNEHSLYDKALKILPKYKDAFEAEGNGFIYENKLKENIAGKDMYDKGLSSRYLYIVE